MFGLDICLCMGCGLDICSECLRYKEYLKDKPDSYNTYFETPPANQAEETCDYKI